MTPIEYVVPARVALILELAFEAGYGMQLTERLRERTGGRIRLLQGSIYPTLKRLANEGLIESKIADGTGSRERVYYFLTRDGRKLADEYREALRGLVRGG